MEDRLGTAIAALRIITMETAMAGETTRHSSQYATRINVDEDHEVRCRTTKLGGAAAQSVAAVTVVGPTAADVERRQKAI